MKRLLLFFILIFLAQAAFSKGASGKYFIEGRAFDSKNFILPYSLITVDFNNQLTLVRTDGTGDFRIEVEWHTACPTGAAEGDIERDNDLMNPKWIFLTCNDIEIKVEHQWRKYGMLSYKNESGNIRKLDLNFKKE